MEQVVPINYVLRCSLFSGYGEEMFCLVICDPCTERYQEVSVRDYA